MRSWSAISNEAYKGVLYWKYEGDKTLLLSVEKMLFEMSKPKLLILSLSLLISNLVNY